MSQSVLLLSCAGCATAMADLALPPIFLWSFLAAGWFFGASFVAPSGMRGAIGVPKPFRAFLAIMVVGVIGASFIGPIALLPLAVPPLILGFHLFSKRVKGEWGEAHTRKIAVFAGLMAASFLGLSAYSVSIHMTRSPADFILQWENTASARYMAKSLAARTPPPLDEYRKLLQSGRRFAMETAADALALHGSSVTDVPLLIAALDQLQRDEDGGSGAPCNKIERALAQLSGLDLPGGTPASEWKTKWSEKLIGPPQARL